MEQRVIEEFERLAGLLNKYGHRWATPGGPSPRLQRWHDRYNELRRIWRDEFLHYCIQTGADPSHKAFDCMA